MAYTEFRKSYGDFEIVIPAIDFSELVNSEAIDTIMAFNAYGQPSTFGEWVCHYLDRNTGVRTSEVISKTIDPHHKGLENFIQNSMNGIVVYPKTAFNPYNPPGRVLRIEWCKHMAKEIKREFDL